MGKGKRGALFSPCYPGLSVLRICGRFRFPSLLGTRYDFRSSFQEAAMVKRKRPTRTKKPRPAAKKRKSKIDLKPAERTLREVRGKLNRLTITRPEDITDDHVDAAEEVATAMHDMVSGLKEAIKRAAMADGQLAPGKTITSGGRLVYVKLRPGRSEGSTDPDDYDLVTEPIH